MTSGGEKEHGAGRPAVVLVRPQLGENVGACARAMWNCGLDDLRLVEPRDGWPNPRALAAATGAAWVIERARVFPSLAAATADCALIVATSARRREMTKDGLTPRQAASLLHAAASRRPPERGALVFGCERTGLDNDDVALASHLVQVPLNPQFNSLNLAQAVLLLAWEWYRDEAEAVGVAEHRQGLDQRSAELASGGEMENFFEHLEQELDRARFFRVAEKRAGMVRSIRALLRRAQPARDELRVLHGVVSALVGRRKDGAPVRQAGSKSGDAVAPEPPDPRPGRGQG
ncbi:MAG: RNA methyltransferase [Acidobacteria bacterium]|nr:MAG: RNA methyltransferase [Acidobacteriota bacterium]REK08395.1 MAG: RNA methyltransferase [Acidobacteriota bacterium]